MAVSTAELVERLPSLFDQLRNAGYPLGAAEAINAHRLILGPSFGDYESLTDEQLERLRRCLGPLFCQTPEQQEDFPAHFDHWLITVPRYQEREVIETGTEDAGELASPRPRSSLRALLGFLAVCVAAVFYLLVRPDPQKRELTKQPPDAGVDPGVVVEPATSTNILDTLLDALSGAWGQPQVLTAIGLVLAGLIFFWLRRPQITRGTTEGGQAQVLFIPDHQGALLGSTRLRKNVQQLRQHEQVAWQRLDISASIDATIAQGGLFQAVYGTRPQMPEFVLLIETESQNDLQSAVAGRWLDYLQTQGLIVTPFWYVGAPWEFMLDEQGNRFSWMQLQSQYSQNRLVVLGEALGWFDPVHGRLSPQARDVASWQRRVLLTPRSVIDWDRREWLLHELGLTPFYLDEEGLHQVVAHWDNEDKQVEYSVPADHGQFPVRLLDYEGGLTPLPRNVQELLEQLQAYLGEGLFKLLCATALYPECHYGITLHLCRYYLGEINTLGDLDPLQRLARLPWMRSGYMPDWLRLALLRKLSRSELNELRHRLLDMLQQDRPEKTGFELRRFRAPSTRLERIFKGWLRDIDQENLVHDAVFVKTMIGSSPLRLAAERRLPSLGKPAAVSAFAGVVMAILGGIASWIGAEPLLQALDPLVPYLAVAGFFLTLASLVTWLIDAYRSRPVRFRRLLDIPVAAICATLLIYLGAMLTLSEWGMVYEVVYPAILLMATVLALRRFDVMKAERSQLGLEDLLGALEQSRQSLVVGAVFAAYMTLLPVHYLVNQYIPGFWEPQGTSLAEYQVNTGTLFVILDAVDLLGTVLLALAVALAFRRPLALAAGQCFGLAGLAGLGHAIALGVTGFASAIAFLEIDAFYDYYALARIYVASPVSLLGAGFGLAVAGWRLGLLPVRQSLRVLVTYFAWSVVIIGFAASAFASDWGRFGALELRRINELFVFGLVAFASLCWWTRQSQLWPTVGRAFIYVFVCFFLFGVTVAIVQWFGDYVVFATTWAVMPCVHAVLLRSLSIRQLRGVVSADEAEVMQQEETWQPRHTLFAVFLWAPLAGLLVGNFFLRLDWLPTTLALNQDFLVLCIASVLALRHGKLATYTLVMAPIMTVVFAVGFAGSGSPYFALGSWYAAWLLARWITDRDKPGRESSLASSAALIIGSAIGVHVYFVAWLGIGLWLPVIGILLSIRFGYRSPERVGSLSLMVLGISTTYTIAALGNGSLPLLLDFQSVSVRYFGDPFWAISMIVALMVGKTVRLSSGRTMAVLTNAPALVCLMCLSLVSVTASVGDDNLYIWGSLPLACMFAALLGYYTRTPMRWALGLGAVLLLLSLASGNVLAQEESNDRQRTRVPAPPVLLDGEKQDTSVSRQVPVSRAGEPIQPRAKQTETLEREQPQSTEQTAQQQEPLQQFERPSQQQLQPGRQQQQQQQQQKPAPTQQPDVPQDYSSGAGGSGTDSEEVRVTGRPGLNFLGLNISLNISFGMVITLLAFCFTGRLFARELEDFYPGRVAVEGRGFDEGSLGAGSATSESVQSQRPMRKSAKSARESIGESAGEDRQFMSEGEVRDYLANRSFSADEFWVDAMLIYRTRRQRTWLIASNYRLYCLLDDENTSRKGTYVQWQQPLSGGMKIRARTSKQDRAVVDIGNRRNWLYSTRLHPNQESFEAAIRSLIERGMELGRAKK